MRVICDLEANGLNPDKIWVIVCKDIDTGEIHVFKDLESGGKADFIRFAMGISHWCGHNFLGYDVHAIRAVLGLDIDWRCVSDTLVVSRLVYSGLNGHGLADWGETLGRPKLHTDITDWSRFTPEMEERCIGDVETNFLLYQRLSPYIHSEQWKAALETESYVHFLSHILSKNGFAFDTKEALELKDKIDKEIEGLEKNLKVSFVPKVSLVREVTPRATKFGTIAKNSIPKILGPDLSPFSPDAPFSLIEYIPFNPRSHKHRIERLWEAGWQPINKSNTHKDVEKAVRELKRKRGYHPSRKAEIAALEARLGEYGKSGFGYSGWATTDEENLATLPPEAPPALQTLVRFVLLTNRSSTLTKQWLANVGPDGRIHGSFNHIGAWTHRMSHDRPNMGNIPKFDPKQPHKTPYSDQMRALWRSASDRYLVGVDAESIQLRVFGHYIDDRGFINALVSGRKEDGTDPHSLNQKALGTVCKSRDDAKTFIYAWLLGAGIAKIAAILGCSRSEAQEANDNFLTFYPGLKYLKEHVIPEDAARGYFKGFDGRFVRIWGDDTDSRRHFALAGYLQNGEAVVMKRAVQIWYPKLEREKIPFWWVNFVHDEYQIETVRDLDTAKYVAETVADAIREVGVDLGLRCPMAGSVLSGGHSQFEHSRTWNEAKQKYDIAYWAIGDSWLETH